MEYTLDIHKRNDYTVYERRYSDNTRTILVRDSKANLVNVYTNRQETHTDSNGNVIENKTIGQYFADFS